VAIARALDESSHVLILDEPTSSLDKEEVRRLFKILKRLKQEGIAILFVTHFIDQVYEIADCVTVLRNGRLVGEYQTSSLSKGKLVAHMLGRQWTGVDDGEESEVKYKPKDKEIFLEAQGVGHRGSIQPFDLLVNRGEILGLAGLLGSGRTEIARLLFGVDKPHCGSIEVDGKKVQLSPPWKAIELQIGLCPEDRKEEGIIGDLTVRENLILALQAKTGIFKIISRLKQQEIVDRFIEVLDIKTAGPEQVVKNLSGGNQQKVILARWLAANPKMLILDEPTRGIDVGAKAEIEKIVGQLSREGVALIFISSELEEVCRCCDRVAVLRDRCKVGELEGDDISVDRAMTIIAGEAQQC
jgi:simple sugar transport system ATP-binding protein